MKYRRLFAILVIVLLTSVFPVAAQEKGLSDREIWLLYKEFREVRNFGMIAVSLIGDASRIGLNESELTEYAKEKFKQHFAQTKLEDISKDSKKFLGLVGSRERKVGNITIRVWVIGVDYPIVYHIKCDAGNFDNPSIWTEEILGHGSRQSAPEAVKKIIDEMIGSLASIFYKIKGQQTRYSPDVKNSLL